MKSFVKIPLILTPLIVSTPLLFSCSPIGNDKFQKYANINDVIKQKKSWTQTLYSRFGNKGANEFPPNWDFRQTTDTSTGHCYQRFCGGETFIWTKDNVDNSLDGELKINYRQGSTYTDPDDSTFTTNNFTGSISTENQFEQAFGYWEVNAKFLNKHYGWAAFWMQCLSQGQVGNGGEDGSEIDVFESFNWNDFQNEVRLNTMADGYGSSYKEFGTSGYYVDQNGEPINTYNDFHKFGLLWTPTAYYMFVDHNLIFKTNALFANHAHPPGDEHMGVCQVPVFAILSGHMGPGGTAPNGLPFSPYDGPGQFLVKDFVCYQNRNFLKYVKSPSDFT